MTKPSQIIISKVIWGALLTTPAWAMEVPDEIVENILVKLPPQTLARVSPVCKQWQRISDDDRLWKAHGVPSKAKCLDFPFSTLEHDHLVALFKCKYLSSNGIFFWKLTQEVETPDEILWKVGQIRDIKPGGWWGKNTICIKKDINLIQFTTDVTCWAETIPYCTLYTKAPYILTLKGSWSAEQKLPFSCGL